MKTGLDVLPIAMEKHIKQYQEKLGKDAKLAALYGNCYASTAKTALVPCEDGTYFMVTGDINSMWLRDSTAQVTNYISLAKDEEVGKILQGVVRRQFMYLRIDPYANGFNKDPNDGGHTDDLPRKGPWVFERKYEVDSVCYPIRLLYLYWKASGNTEIITEQLEDMARLIVDLFRREQHHMEKSLYRFFRLNPPVPWDTIHNEGMGEPVAYTGMTWSGFRPSDDGCTYGYLTASEMFAVVILRYMAEMLRDVCKNDTLADECLKLSAEIDEGIQKYCIVEHPVYGKIYACETDGMGHYSMIDDANVPSLLSIPYIGYTTIDDEVYQNTRRFLLSKENPYYFEGSAAKGIGSPHTPTGYIWHLGLIMQGLTAISKEEKLEMIRMIRDTDGGTGILHEGFDCNDPNQFTRPWFTWPCSLFAEFIENCVNDGTLD